MSPTAVLRPQRIRPLPLVLVQVLLYYCVLCCTAQLYSFDASKWKCDSKTLTTCALLHNCGRSAGSDCLMLNGTGSTSAYWTSPAISLATAHATSFWVTGFFKCGPNAFSTGGVLPFGLSGANYDASESTGTLQSDGWTKVEMLFRAPSGVSSVPLSMGQWEISDLCLISDVIASLLMPVRSEMHNCPLPRRAGHPWGGMNPSHLAMEGPTQPGSVAPRS